MSDGDPQAILNDAMARHRAGDFMAAAQLYGAVLEHYPDHPQVLHLLGLVAYQTGQLEQAIELISRAIQGVPNDSSFHMNLGEALRASGRVEEALQSYDRALALYPRNADAQANRSVALHQLNRPDEAIVAAELALAIDPNHTVAHQSLGNALRKREPARALVYLRRAVELNPRDPATHSNIALLLSDMGQHENAILHARRATDLSPESPVALINYAHVLRTRGRALRHKADVEEALRIATGAVAVAPAMAAAHTQLATALDELGRLEEAQVEYRRAAEFAPQSVNEWINLGTAQMKLGRVREAAGTFEQALLIDPEHAGAHFDRALALMALGELREGLAEYRWRWKYDLFTKTNPRKFPNLWTGQELKAGSKVLLYGEQGYGDTVHFVRYAKLLADRGAAVHLACSKPLMELMRTAPGVAAVSDIDEAPPASEYQCALMDLPGGFGTTLETIPAEVPYLSALPDKVAAWEKRLAGVKRPRVGLCWAGNPQHADDRARSIEAELLGPLGMVQGVSFVSLQKEARGKPAFEMLGVSGELTDLTETAALIGCLDLVISVDTVVAHLAGALGKPVWTLLAVGTDWRWFLEREDSPWYPTMRLFRQRRAGDWAEVVERVAGELKRLVV